MTASIVAMGVAPASASPRGTRVRAPSARVAPAPTRVAVVGATTFGTTMAITIARARGAGPVTLLARTPDEASRLDADRANQRFLPDVPFPRALTVTADVASLDRSRVLILAVPAQTMRQNVRALRRAIPPGTLVLSAAKGFEEGTGKRMTEVIREELPADLDVEIGVLSGPNLAKEMVRGMPAETVVAARDPRRAGQARGALGSKALRITTTSDVVGVELGGALKNVYAVGAGVLEGRGVGHNGKAGYLTRALEEMTRLGVAAGADRATFVGLAGLGDLLATAGSPTSRNHQVGAQLGAGRKWPRIRKGMKNVAEGIKNLRPTLELADRLHVDVPIARALARLVYEEVPVSKVLPILDGSAVD